jgi:hypothetical protein
MGTRRIDIFEVELCDFIVLIQAEVCGIRIIGFFVRSVDSRLSQTMAHRHAYFHVMTQND